MFVITPWATLMRGVKCCSMHFQIIGKLGVYEWIFGGMWSWNLPDDLKLPTIYFAHTQILCLWFLGSCNKSIMVHSKVIMEFIVESWGASGINMEWRWVSGYCLGLSEASPLGIDLVVVFLSWFGVCFNVVEAWMIGEHIESLSELGIFFEVVES